MKDNLLKRITVGLHAEIDFDARPWTSAKYGTPEYWDAYEKAMESEAKDFRDFIRDHRSRDEYCINIVREYQNICKFCGFYYPDGYSGVVDCCDAAISAQQEYIKSLVDEN